MRKFERQAAIERLAKSRNYILISDLSRELEVSESTVRRDLEEMEAKELLFRSQGAVVWNDRDDQHMENVFYRQIQNVDEKKLLASYAVSLIAPGDTLFIDTGTTMLELAKRIGTTMPLNVVTNDIHVAFELESKFNVSTIVLGGFLKHGTHTVVGSMPLQNLEGLHFQKMFISPGGITREGGFMFFNIQAMDVRRKVQCNSDQVIMVTDSSKFGKNGFVSGFRFDQCDVLVTDSIPPEWEEILSQHMTIQRAS